MPASEITAGADAGKSVQACGGLDKLRPKSTLTVSTRAVVRESWVVKPCKECESSVTCMKSDLSYHIAIM